MIGSAIVLAIRERRTERTTSFESAERERERRWGAMEVAAAEIIAQEWKALWSIAESTKALVAIANPLVRPVSLTVRLVSSPISLQFFSLFCLIIIQFFFYRLLRLCAHFWILSSFLVSSDWTICVNFIEFRVVFRVLLL